MEEDRIQCGKEALCFFDFEMMEGLLELKGMRFHAFHGCLPQERVDGGEYPVGLEHGLFEHRSDLVAKLRGFE